MILITGGTGFLGRHLIKEILDTTGFDVTVISRQSNFFQSPRIGFVKPVRSEIRNYFVKNSNPVILHLATDYGRSDLSSSSKIVREVNLDLPTMILEECAASPPRLFVNCDSYYLKGGRERLALRDYVDSKTRFRDRLREDFSFVNSVTLQFEHIFGPGDSTDKFIPMLITRALRDQSGSLDLTGGEQRRDFLYVKDAALAVISVLKDYMTLPKSGMIIEVGTGVKTSLKDLVLMVLSEANSKLVPNFGSLPYISGELQSSVANLEIMSYLGWKPSVYLQEGLVETINHFRESIDRDN